MWGEAYCPTSAHKAIDAEGTSPRGERAAPSHNGVPTIPPPYLPHVGVVVRSVIDLGLVALILGPEVGDGGLVRLVARHDATHRLRWVCGQWHCWTSRGRVFCARHDASRRLRVDELPLLVRGPFFHVDRSCPDCVLLPVDRFTK